MKQKLFGTSGIRGVVNKDLTLETALNIGRAIGTYIEGGKVVVGLDTRVSSSMQENAIVAGLTACGATIYQTGIIPTPALAFLTKTLEMDAGIMITASHNPPEYNGIKLFNKDGTAYTETQENQIENIISKKTFKLADWKAIKESMNVSETQRYIDAILNHVRLKRKWKIVLDVGNGATYQLAPQIFSELGCKITTINSHPDGFFPGRGALPEGEALRSLCNVVRGLKADLGIAYDGDGDRMTVVDEKGEPALLDQIIAAYAAHITRKHEKGIVVTHVEASACMEKMVERYGGKVVRTKVGDVSIVSAMKKHKAAFGGEPCGAWIHPQVHYCPDGILSSALLLKALEEEDKTLSAFVAEVPQYAIERKSIACPNPIKYAVLAEVGKNASKVFPKIVEKLRIDGLRLKLDFGWILVRASGTEPLIRVTVEAKTRQKVAETINKTLDLVNRLVKEKSR